LLAPSFEIGQWRPKEAVGTSEPEAVDRRNGSCVGGILPLGVGGPAPWTDAVVRALGALPSGLRASWRFRPASVPPPVGERPPGLEAQFQPPGFRLRGLPGPEREARDREVLARNAPTWAVELVLSATDPALPPLELDRWAVLIATASARSGRGRLAFRKPGRIFGSRPPTFLLSEPELLGVLPTSATYYPSEPAPERPGSYRLPFGRDSNGGIAEVEVHPEQGRHLVALGETGMGKSSLLVRLARTAAGHGNIVLFDPIGDTGRSFLGSLPSRFLRDVIWVSPHSSPVAVDLLAALRGSARSPASADRAMSDLVSALRRVRAARYPEASFWGPRIEETVRATLRAATLIPGTTLADLPRLLTPGPRRPVGVPESAREAYDELTARVRERPEEVDGSRRLLGEVTDRPVLLSLLGAVDARFAVGEMLLPGRITVLTGDAPTIGEDAARYLLAVYLALFWSERLATAAPPKTFLILDEAQWYAHDSVAEMLRLGRRANLHVWMATQALDALSENVRAAIQTNVADFLVFRGSPADARDLARMISRLDLDTIWSQPAGHAVGLLGKGERIVVARIDPPFATAPEQLERRLATLRDLSSRFLPSAASERSSVPYAGVEGPTTPPAGSATSSGARIILLALWSELLDLDAREPARFYLAELRRTFDPMGAGVREVGRLLRDVGALVRADRDERGTFWEVGRGGFERLLGPGVDPRSLDDASRRWRARDRSAGPTMTE